MNPWRSENAASNSHNHEHQLVVCECDCDSESVYGGGSEGWGMGGPLPRQIRGVQPVLIFVS